RVMRLPSSIRPMYHIEVSSRVPVHVSCRAMTQPTRLSAIDWLRGLVMVLMTIDHASGAFNAGRLMTDAAFMYKPGTTLDPAQFATRWVTPLCAPTFVFLAGLSLSISADRRRAGRDRAGRGSFPHHPRAPHRRAGSPVDGAGPRPPGHDLVPGALCDWL